MAVRSTQGQNRAVRSTPGGRGVSRSKLLVNFLMKLHCYTCVTYDDNWKSNAKCQLGYFSFYRK